MKVGENSKCHGCPMQRLFPAETFVPPKFGNGKRLCIAEAPGETESIVGEPLVGGSGKVFDMITRKAGLRREDLTLCNVIQCRPPANVFPTDAEARSYISADEAEQAVRHCLTAHVEPLLNSQKWTRIDLLGAKPLEFIAHKKGGIFNWRGSPVEIPGHGMIGMPTLHPASVMRDQSSLPLVINDFIKGTTPPPENYNLFPSLQDVRDFDATEFAFDLETSYTQHNEIKVCGLSAKPYTAMVVPFSGPYIPELKRIFANAREVIGQNNLQFDTPILANNGIKLSEDCVQWDTMLMHHLRFPDLPHDLETIASQFTTKPAWKSERKTSGLELYNARDVDITLQAYKQLRPILKAARLEDLYLNIQVPLARMCYLLHLTGFKIDPKSVDKVREKLQAEMLVLEQKLPEYLRTKEHKVLRRKLAPEGTLGAAGKPVKYVKVEVTEYEVPWRSPQVIAKFLYEDLKLPVQFHVKTDKMSTGKIALDKLFYKTKEPAILALKKLRNINTLLGSFATEKMQQATRQYSHFSVHGTSSGRLSSSDPNLQNVPESTRYIYVPSHAGWKIINCDFSGIENRLTAYLAHDEERLRRFVTDPSFSEHKYAASKYYGIPYEEVEKSSDPDSYYSKAKHIVHGKNYGLGAVKCSKMYGMELKETKDFMAAWSREIQATTLWQESTAARAKRDGYLTTPFGRKRWFYTSSAYTESLSFLPQSTAADILFRSMLGLMYERIKWPLDRVLKVVQVVEPLPEPARMLLTVHDSLVFESPAELVDKVVDVVLRVMQQGWPELGGFSIPVSVEVGDSWGDTEAYVPPEKRVLCQ